MGSELSRRKFVQQSVLASAGAALAMQTGGRDSAAIAAPAVSASALPLGKIGDMEISRLLLGGNLLTHYTHSRDLKYVYALAKHYNTPEKILDTLAIAEDNGINTLVVHNVRSTIEILQKHRERGGKMQWITCTFHALASGDLNRFNKEIEELVDSGTDAVYVSGVEADTLCGYTNNISAANSADRVSQPKLDLLGQAVDMAKAHGLPTGLGAHRLGTIVDCEKAGIDVDFYLKTHHHHKYPTADLQHDSSFCPEPEKVAEFMAGVKKPWIAFKVMAAGAIPPENAFKTALDAGADFVLAGMFDFEIAEDARILRKVLPQVQRKRPWLA